jgi:hypothetical protein
MGVDSGDEGRRPSDRPAPATLGSAEAPPAHRFDSTPPLAAEGDDALSDEGIDNPPGPTIFVSDPTVEAARIEWALRARGYVVIDVPLAMLVGRAAVQRPHLVLLDVDAPGALDVAARMRSLPGAGGVHLIYAGHAGQTFGNARDALAHEGSGFFARPIDIEALIEKIDALLGVAEEHVPEPAQGAPSSPKSGPPSNRVPMAPPRRSSRPPPPPSLRAPPSPLPPRPLPVPPGGPISLMPPSTQSRAPGEVEQSSEESVGAAASSDKRGWSAKAAETRLSPDLEKLLRDAEARVVGPTSQRMPESGMSSDEDVLSPEDEVEAVLPAEILASLDEPLDLGVEDDEGSSADTGTPRGGTTGGGVRAKTTGTTAARTATGPVGTATGPEPIAIAPSGTSAGTEEPVLTTSGGRDLTGAKTGAGSAADIAILPSHDAEPQPPAFRQASTPKPPRRVPNEASPRAPIDDAHSAAAGTNAGDDDEVDERGQSQVSQQMAMPRPASEHPPPLAPITARPPPIANAPPAQIPAPPPSPAVGRPALEDLDVDARPMPRSMAAGYGLAATPQPAPVAAREAPSTALPSARPITSSDEALRAFAQAVATRVTGVLRVDEAAGIRRIVLQDGDVVTAASSVEGESLLGYLQSRGDLAADVVKRLEGRVPPFGRLAGAALVAHGHLHQEQLWDVLQAHAAWLLTRTVAVSRGQLAFESEAPARLKGEPPVFGGTPGPALVVEIARRAVTPAEAIARLGGPEVRLATGERGRLVDECGLEEGDETLVRSAVGASVREVVAARGDEVAPLLYALVALGVISALAAARPAVPAPRPAPGGGAPSEPIDALLDAELDDGAVRARIAARRALVEDGDYFAILGVPRAATGYEIRRAYVELRRALDPSRVLRPSLADLVSDLELVLQVLDEAYDVLKDATRRERYRRAISHEPPQ